MKKLICAALAALIIGLLAGYVCGYNGYHGDYKLVQITTPNGSTLYALEKRSGFGFIAYDCEGNVID